MKKVFSFLTGMLICSLLMAQAPQGISHQAVIRNSLNEIVTNSTVGIRVSILQGSPTGTLVYRETQTPVSNANGLITYIIGQGTVGTGVFEDIGWSDGPYYLKTEADPTGGTSYTITGTTQILSIPYAFYADSSGNGFASIYSGSDPRPVLYDDGTIGIGTSTNWAKLNVNGRIVIQPGQDTWGSQININASSLEKGKAYLLTSTGGDAAEGQGKLIIGCSGKGNGIVIDSSLNVGIGTDNPVSKLDVNGEINVNSNKITNVADPVADQDAATKAYVDKLLDIIQTLNNGIKDVVGYHYKVTLIGDQFWMAENLKTTHYADGTPIPHVSGSSNWGALTATDKAYCWYNDDSTTYANTYGALYTWAAAMNGATSSSASPSGVQGACPTGWHLPSNAEWTTLSNYLGGIFVAGGKLKETDTIHWTTPNFGATNEYNFSALPCGCRTGSGSFISFGYEGDWWSATEDFGAAWYRYMSYNGPHLDLTSGSKKVGFSVRCVKD